MNKRQFIKRALKYLRKKLSASSLLIIAAMLLITITLVYKKPHSDLVIPDGYLSVHYIDVGQGDASLMIDSDGHTILIDTGTSESKYYICDYLDKYKVKDVDLLILSHPHSDHIGGAERIINKFNVKKILMPNAVSDTPVFESLIDAMEKRNKTVTLAEQNDVFTVGGMTVTVLSPFNTYTDENDMSIVAKISYGNCSFLFTGDISAAIEKDIVSEYQNSVLKSDIIKIAHHGSKYSSCDAFLSAVSPSLAVISCGADNDYGHPHRDTTERLGKHNIPYFVTSKHGTVVLASNGNDIILIDPSELQ